MVEMMELKMAVTTDFQLVVVMVILKVWSTAELMVVATGVVMVQKWVH